MASRVAAALRGRLGAASILLLAGLAPVVLPWVAGLVETEFFFIAMVAPVPASDAKEVYGRRGTCNGLRPFIHCKRTGRREHFLAGGKDATGKKQSVIICSVPRHLLSINQGTIACL